MTRQGSATGKQSEWGIGVAGPGLDAAASARGPLAGIKIVEYGDLVTAPYASKLLADLGATVVKIEAPHTGDRSRAVGPFPGDRPDAEQSGLFIYLNGKKRGVTLDVTSATGRGIFDRLVADADMLIENVELRDSERLGLSPERLRGVNGNLIHLSITPFGHRGPYSADRGYALNAEAMSGAVLANGDADREPLPLPDFLSDWFTGTVGAMSCMLAITGLESDVDGTGGGEWIDLSSANAWMTFQTGLGVVTWLFGSRRTMREGRRHRGGPYPWTIMPCKDGEFRLIAMTKREWSRFVEVMGTPQWSKDERFQDRLKMNELYADELDALIKPWFAERTKAELFALFYEAGVPFTPVMDFRDVLEDPQLNARDFFVEVEQPGVGTLTLPGLPYHFSEAEVAAWRPAPALGQHNHEVFCEELGIEPAELVALAQAGVL